MTQKRKTDGIVCALGVSVLFIILAEAVRRHLHGVAWYLFSSATRLLFGLGILFLMRELYGTRLQDVFSFRNWRQVLAAGCGFFLYFAYFLLELAVGASAVSGLSAALLVSQIILQQITTGFYEELCYRALILEGYFSGGKRTRDRKFCYAAISAVIFGLLHVIDGWSISKFLLTGSIGFAFAAMYLQSHNILIPILLHAGYDVFANLTEYITWNGAPLFLALERMAIAPVLVMLLLSVTMLLRRLPET